MTMMRSFVAAGVLLASATLLSAPANASTALTLGAVHLLSGPANTFGPVGDLPSSSKVGVLWCGPANFDWCLVQFHKKQGWVHSGDLSGLTAAGGELADTTSNKSASDGGSSGTGGGTGTPAARAALGTGGGSNGGVNAGSVGSGGSKAVGGGL